MRLSRIVAVLVGLLLALAGPLAVHPADAAGKPKHDVKITKAEKVPNSKKFFVAGKVSTYPSHKIALLQSKGKGGKRSVAKKSKTDSQGKFRIVFSGPIGECFFVDVPSTPSYRETIKAVGCIIAARPAANAKIAA